MKKRVISLLMCVAMVLSIAVNPLLAEKASAATGFDFSTYSVRMNNFINDARWKDGASWGDRKPYVSPWDSKQCKAYVDDFCYYVYGTPTCYNEYFTLFDDASQIRAGDIIYTEPFTNSKGDAQPEHWFVVLSRDGNTIKSAEGNFSSRTKVTTEHYAIVNGKLVNKYDNNWVIPLGKGYHYNFSGNVPATGDKPSGCVDLGASFNASIFRTDHWVTFLSDTATLGTGGRHARSVWSFKRQSNGAYIITSMYDGKVLDVYGAGKSDGTKVWTCDKWVDSSGSNAAQEWYICKNGDGYRFVPRLVTNKAMTCVHDSYGPKTPMNLQAWISRGSQIFSIYKQTEVFPTGISTSNKTIKAGESTTLSYTISPSNTNSKYVGATFSSSNTNVVTVDENGTIKGIKPGTATVTVAMAFNERKTAKATITVESGVCTHKWDGGMTVAPTCTTTGERLLACQYCGEKKTEVIPKKGHNIVKDAAVAATCTSTGLTAGEHCTNCSYKVAQQVIKKEPHQYGKWETVATPTCQEQGLKSQTCKICDYDNNVFTDVVDHETGDWYIDVRATTKNTGVKILYCEFCWEEIKSAKIPKLGNVKLSTTTYTYNGKAKNPKVKVYDKNGNLISASNYTVKKASGRKSVGKYTYKITFKNEYKGTETVSFKINPKATSLTKSPTAAKKGFTVKWKKISSQASGYEIMYATNSKFTKGKKTVKVTSYKTTSKKITKLSAKKKYYVKVRTYKTVSGKKYYSAWSNVKSVKTK